jgi:uncharacterized membrane protein
MVSCHDHVAADGVADCLMHRTIRVLGWVAIAAAVVTYIFLANYVTTRSAKIGWLVSAIAFAPYFGFALVLAWRSPRRYWMLALCVVCAGVVLPYAKELAQHFGALYFLDHAGANVVLGIIFGRTLSQNRVPLCSRLAAMVHGPLDERVARYTRQVTIAWTVFFVAMAALSILVFFAGPIEMWSAFASIFSLPLIAVMFGAEYAVRLRVLPDMKHVSILDSVRIYLRSSKDSLPPS